MAGALDRAAVFDPKTPEHLKKPGEMIDFVTGMPIKIQDHDLVRPFVNEILYTILYSNRVFVLVWTLSCCHGVREIEPYWRRNLRNCL